MNRFFTVFVWLLIATPSLGDPLPENERPDKDTYRVRVEVVLEGPDDLAVYRVRIWTLEKRELSFLYGDGTELQGGLSRLEAESKLYRGDFIFIASLQPSEDPKDVGKLRYTYDIRAGGLGGGITSSHNVDGKTQLAKAIKIGEKSLVSKLGKRSFVGRAFGRAIEVHVK